MTKRDIAQAKAVAAELKIRDRDEFRRFVERNKRDRGFRGDLSYAELRWLGQEFLAERGGEGNR